TAAQCWRSSSARWCSAPSRRARPPGSQPRRCATSPVRCGRGALLDELALAEHAARLEGLGEVAAPLLAVGGDRGALVDDGARDAEPMVDVPEAVRRRLGRTWARAAGRRLSRALAIDERALAVARVAV